MERKKVSQSRKENEKGSGDVGDEWKYKKSHKLRGKGKEAEKRGRWRRRVKRSVFGAVALICVAGFTGPMSWLSL